MNLNALSLTELEQLFEKTFGQKEYFSELRAAYNFAKDGHGEQKRDQSPEIPYIIHPLRMLVIAYKEFGIEDVDMFKGILFHDLLEDTQVIDTEIKKFGDMALMYTLAMTRVRDPKETPDQKYESKRLHFQKILSSSENIRQLKMLDLIDNMRDWLFIPAGSDLSKKFPRWLAQVNEMTLPLAKTLGQKYVDAVKEVYEQIIQKGYSPIYDNFTA